MDDLSPIHFLILFVIGFGFIILYFAAIIRILQKAGYSGWWCLIVFVPVMNVIMFYVFAFSTWPVLRGQVHPRYS
jgi:uncharacterized membrane protein YhaH (DUF805 family)